MHRKIPKKLENLEESADVYYGLDSALIGLREVGYEPRASNIIFVVHDKGSEKNEFVPAILMDGKKKGQGLLVTTNIGSAQQHSFYTSADFRYIE